MTTYFMPAMEKIEDRIPLSLRIRQDLSAMHTMVEAHPRLAILISPNLMSADYIGVLARLYGFYLPLEEALLANQTWIPDVLRSAPRWPRLAEDLSWWGVNTSSLPVAPAAKLPSVHTAEAAVGVAYVLEGAALGGRLIAQHVQKTLKLELPHGISFHAEGNKAASHWNRVREALDDYPDHSHEAIIASAARTYQALHDWV